MIVDRRVLVTGATGFLGRPALRALVDGGWQVDAIARRVPDDVHGEVEWHRADVLNDGQLEATVSAVGATHLLHLAWCAEPGRFWTDPKNLDWVGATARLVAAFAAAGGRRIVAAGSCAEYDWSYGWCREEHTPLRPETFYGSAKAAAGILVTAWSREVGISAAWARLFHLYGPGEPDGKLVSSIVAGLRAGRDVPLSSGEQVRDFLHCHDAAAALVHLLDADVEGPVNVASGRGVSVREVAMMLGDAAGATHRLDFGARPGASGEPPLLVADARRLAATGWAPAVDLRLGLAALVRGSA